MGNGVGKLTHCCSGGIAPIRRRRHVSAAVTFDPYDESLGHSFCYVRPNLPPCSAPCAAAVASAKVHHHAEEATTFCSISGASICANAATPLSTSLQYNELTWPQAASAFESSDSFAAVPLQPVPRFSGPLLGSLADSRGFLSGPIERGFMSGPLDPRAGLFSAPLDRAHIGHSLSLRPRPRGAASSLFRRLSSALSRTKKSDSSDSSAVCTERPEPPSGRLSVEGAVDDSDSLDPANGHNVQWAQGKAGEDRVHVVVSEEHGWVFVGIYDGFNGPDATDFLLSNLYSAVLRELEGHLWEDKFKSQREPPSADAANTHDSDASISTTWIGENGRRCTEESKKRRRFRGVAKKWEENQRRWKCEWDRERLELDRRLKEQSNWTSSGSTVDHLEVLKALSKALRKTEEAYLDIADKMVSENPELALMGSCVLVMLMKGDDVYLMNVGDSRAVLARKAELDVWGSIGKATQDLERIKEETFHDLEAYDCSDGMHGVPNLAALQMTLDHSTCVKEEVRRIKNEHPDDASAIVNDRVKGSLKVTRAFGAGYLKQPKWNNALLEMFRIDYVGISPYITCSPFLYHHRLGSKDRFLILSSDGLYQYFTNEEAVSQVEMFIKTCPEGDPAQHLVEEVLFRAAKKAGMDFHELLEIPQGDRRRYHDDVSIIVISLEGRIWRSCV